MAEGELFEEVEYEARESVEHEDGEEEVIDVGRRIGGGSRGSYD